jgi:hypothetical protein
VESRRKSFTLLAEALAGLADLTNLFMISMGRGKNWNLRLEYEIASNYS